MSDTEKNYDEMNSTELKDAARDADIQGRSSMNSDELRAALKASASGDGDGEASPRGTGEAESDDVTGDSGGVHDSALGGAGGGSELGVGFEGVEAGEAARMAEDAELANLAPRGAPGPQPPRSAAAAEDAKYGQPGE